MNIYVNKTESPNDKIHVIFKILNAFITSIFVIFTIFTRTPPAFAEFHEVDGIKWNYEILDGGTNVKIVYGSEPADTSAGNISGSITVPKFLHLDDKVYTVTEIGDGAFDSTVAYGGITSITLPDSITAIGNLAFKNLNNLTAVIISGNNLQSIGTSAFYGCKNLNSITLPNSLTSIGNYAFYNCQNLGSIIIPDNVTSIGTYTFRNCSNLTSAIIGKSVTALTGTFIGCGNLESVTIPNSVENINYYAFYGCNNLTSLTVPCDFDKNKFSPSSASYINIPATDLDDDPDNDVNTFTVQGTSASGTFTYTHNYENPTYTWTYDEVENKWTCIAKMACSGCGDEITENGTVTGEMTRQATCSAMGETNYTAVFTNSIFSTQTKSVEDIAIDPNAHIQETGWAHNEDKHWHKCTLCEATTDESEHSWELDSIITEATDTTPGEIRYLCSVCGQEKIETILPHHNSDDTEEVEELTNSEALEDTVKHLIDIGAEKLKSLVDKYIAETPEQPELSNPDTGDNRYIIIVLVTTLSSLKSLLEL